MASQDIPQSVSEAEDNPPGSNPLVLLAAGAVLGASGYMWLAKRPLNARGPGVQQAYTAYGAQQSRTSRRHTRPLPGSTQQAPATVNDQRRSGVEPAAAPGLGGSLASSMAGSIVGNVIGSQIGKALGGGGNSQAPSGTAASEPVDQDTPPAPGPSNDHVAQEDPYAYTEPQEQQGTNSWGDSGWGDSGWGDSGGDGGGGGDCDGDDGW